MIVSSSALDAQCDTGYCGNWYIGIMDAACDEWI
jgi:hypothetical protein